MENKSLEIPSNDNVIDISIDSAKRTRFRINGDNSAIIELNLSDLGIMDRMEKGLKELQDEMSRIAEIPGDADNISELMRQADERMRKCVDYIFDYPVSAACCKYGTMYDPKDGKFRYESIIDGLTKLYADNINAEYNKVKGRLAKHTEKYVATKKRKK